jgi:hypothetical protein
LERGIPSLTSSQQFEANEYVTQFSATTQNRNANHPDMRVQSIRSL